MSGHLGRCGSREGATAASPSRRCSWLGATSSWRHSPHVRIQDAPLRFSRRLASGTLLNRLAPGGAVGAQGMPGYRCQAFPKEAL
jgi:hypothetical protein